jgi:hypothetical protein
MLAFSCHICFLLPIPGFLSKKFLHLVPFQSPTWTMVFFYISVRHFHCSESDCACKHVTPILLHTCQFCRHLECVPAAVLCCAPIWIVVQGTYSLLLCQVRSLVFMVPTRCIVTACALVKKTTREGLHLMTCRLSCQDCFLVRKEYLSSPSRSSTLAMHFAALIHLLVPFQNVSASSPRTRVALQSETFPANVCDAIQRTSSSFSVTYMMQLCVCHHFVWCLKACSHSLLSSSVVLHTMAFRMISVPASSA